MRRLPLLVLALLPACAPEARTLADEPSAVGSLCNAAPTGTLEGNVCGSDTRTAAFELGGDVLHIALCEAGYLGGSVGIYGNIHMRVLAPTLGIHTIESGAASASVPDAPWDDIYGWEGTLQSESGWIEIDGFDPVTGSICGSFSLTFADTSSYLGDDVAAGTFEATGH